MRYSAISRTKNPSHISKKGNVSNKKRQKVILGAVFVGFLVLALLGIVYISVRSNSGVNVEGVINKDLNGFGMGGGLAAVGMTGFDVGKPTTKMTRAKEGKTSEAKMAKDHHQHNEFKAPIVRKNEDPSMASVHIPLDVLPKAAVNDFDAVTDIVVCSTSKGNLTIDVRSKWAPKGVDQFLKLVRLGHFNDLPFYRVCPRYITQFGRKYLAPGTPDPLEQNHISVIKDDTSLWGLRDMDFGYLFFAGSGPNSRFDEMVVALCPMKGCIATGLGHADWEVLSQQYVKKASRF